MQIKSIVSLYTSTQITLTDRFGKMNKRKQQAVIRFRKYNKETDPSNWYRAKLMLCYPWFDEQADLLGQYATYEEHYRHVKTIVQTNESKYTKADIDDIQLMKMAHLSICGTALHHPLKKVECSPWLKVVNN